MSKNIFGYNRVRADRVFLTNEQKKFIRKNHKKMTMREMENELKIPSNRIYKFVVRAGLEVKRSHIQKQKSFHFSNGMFNPHAHENWIV